MFANQNHRLDFADTRAAGPGFTAVHAVGGESVFTFAGMSRIDSLDITEQLAQADAADRQLLRLVLCVALATLILALASSLVG